MKYTITITQLTEGNSKGLYRIQVHEGKDWVMSGLDTLENVQKEAEYWKAR